MAELSIRNVHKSFGMVEVLKGIDIDVADGEFLILVGSSGCGKSTLLNIIAGLETVTSGEIRIGGRVVNELPPKSRDIAMVFQSYALYPSMTVRDNISFGLEVRKVPTPERKRIVQEVAASLQIGHLLDRKPKQLSGGQRQRVAMGRALARDPALFLFDEPLSNLDAQLRIEMRSELKLMHRRLGKTICYVTHDQVEAMTLGDRIAVMKGGVVQQLGSPQEIYDSPANRYVAGFIGAPPMNFIEVELEAMGPGIGVHLETSAGRFPLQLPFASDEFKAGPGGKVVLGIRPERITSRRSAEGCQMVDVVVDVTEPTGPDTLAFFTANGARALARVHPDRDPRAGEKMTLAFDLSQAVLFDPSDGKRLDSRHADPSEAGMVRVADG
jgi:multiple sugar transport system ATP-binding protein